MYSKPHGDGGAFDGFDFDVADEVPETLAPDGEELERLRTEIAKTYPDFAKRVFG